MYHFDMSKIDHFYPAWPSNVPKSILVSMEVVNMNVCAKFTRVHVFKEPNLVVQ